MKYIKYVDGIPFFVEPEDSSTAQAIELLVAAVLFALFIVYLAWATGFIS